MSTIIVITFDDEVQAGKVRESMHSLEQEGYLSLDDSAVLVKDQAGKIHVKDQTDRGLKTGAVGGSILGLLIGGIFFPVAGLLLGAAAGALVGKAADLGIDKKFVEQVETDMLPGSSAIFLLVREANPDMAIAALRPYKGKLYHSSLGPDGEKILRDTLSKGY